MGTESCDGHSDTDQTANVIYNFINSMLLTVLLDGKLTLHSLSQNVPSNSLPGKTSGNFFSIQMLSDQYDLVLLTIAHH